MDQIDTATQIGGKVPPQAVESEKYLIGAFLQDNEAVVSHLSKLHPDDFYNSRHGEIAKAMAALEKAMNPVDAMTVINQLIETQKLDQAGGQGYILELLEGVASAANIEYHIDVVKEKSVLRQLISSCNGVVTKAFEVGVEAKEVIDVAEKAIYGISEENIQGTTRHVRDVLAGTMKLIESYDQQGIHGVPTGFSELDEITSGLQPADFIVLAGRPAMGKTAFALSLVANSTIDFQKKVVFFSLEMGGEQLIQRVLCGRANLSMLRLRQSRLTMDEMAKIPIFAEPIENSPMYIDDQPGLSLPQLRSKCRALARQLGGLDMIVIDYLQLMEGEKGSENRNQEVAKISRGLKMLAKELKLPIIALAQLSRKTEDRPGAEKGIPALSDLRDSGAIEQDADMVWFVHRPKYYEAKGDVAEEQQGLENPGEEAKIIVAKHRNGPTGAIPVTFVAECAAFFNYTPMMEPGFE